MMRQVVMILMWMIIYSNDDIMMTMIMLMITMVKIILAQIFVNLMIKFACYDCDWEQFQLFCISSQGSFTSVRLGGKKCKCARVAIKLITT